MDKQTYGKIGKSNRFERPPDPFDAKMECRNCRRRRPARVWRNGHPFCGMQCAEEWQFKEEERRHRG